MSKYKHWTTLHQNHKCYMYPLITTHKILSLHSAHHSYNFKLFLFKVNCYLKALWLPIEIQLSISWTLYKISSLQGNLPYVHVAWREPYKCPHTHPNTCHVKMCMPTHSLARCIVSALFIRTQFSCLISCISLLSKCRYT